MVDSTLRWLGFRETPCKVRVLARSINQEVDFFARC